MAPKKASKPFHSEIPIYLGISFPSLKNSGKTTCKNNRSDDLNKNQSKQWFMSAFEKPG
jgi:hypothetical protein